MRFIPSGTFATVLRSGSRWWVMAKADQPRNQAISGGSIPWPMRRLNGCVQLDATTGRASARQATVEGTDLFLTGVTMGGGPDHWAVEAHLRKGLRVYATPDAARTFDDDLTSVEAMGLRIVDGPDGVGGARRLEMRDFYFSELMDALKSFQVSTAFDAVAVAVFDHGAAPPGVSDRRFRFDYLRKQVERGTGLTGFGFLAGEIPARMTRMRAVARTWTGSEPLFLMD